MSAENCRHSKSESVTMLMHKHGWNKVSETAKAIRFEKLGFSVNFNGEDNTYLDIIIDPILAGANFMKILELDLNIHERFSSNFQNFPKKSSPKGKQQHFGIGLKFGSLDDVSKFLKSAQFPEVV